MNRICTNLASSFFLLIAFASCAQKTQVYPVEFYKYLKEKQFYNEQLAYLNYNPASCENALCADTQLLEKALCLYALNDTTTCNQVLSKATPHARFANEKQQQDFVALLFLQRKWELMNNRSMQDTNAFFNRQAKLFGQVLQRKNIFLKPADSVVMMDYNSRSIIERYNNRTRKSALVAGLLSAFIPGSGKLYAGYKRQAFSAFITNVFFAAQATEALVRSGVKSLHFVYACSVFGVYYIGNIAGSVLAVKKKKRDQLNQLDSEILDYYSGLAGLNAR